jgi:DNA (cytosine-5)-methyltransferase 1
MLFDPDLTIGSLFSGYGGLDMAVESFFGAETSWFVEFDKNVSRVLDARWPGVPNYGDITKLELDDLSRVDIITGGFPCQDISNAGNGTGIEEGTRSGLWFYMRDSIRHLRPRHVIVENVGRLRTKGLDIVLGQMAEIGYHARWCSLRASEVGAPHQRDRIFLWFSLPNTYGGGSGSTQIDRGVGRLDRADEGPSSRDERAWSVSGNRVSQVGPYADAFQRWELELGRPPPHPGDGSTTNGHPAPNPVFIEWLMGLPRGWVTDILNPNQTYKALGNGVVPQQAYRALELMDAFSNP